MSFSRDRTVRLKQSGLTVCDRVVAEVWNYLNVLYVEYGMTVYDPQLAACSIWRSTEP